MSLNPSLLPSPNAELLDELDVLIKKDQMLEVWDKIQKLQPLEQWENGKPRRMAALICSRLGNRRLSSVLDYLNHRHDRDHPKWAISFLYRKVTRTPQSEVIKMVDEVLVKHRDSEMMEPKLIADYLLYKAWLLATLRDFDRAHLLVDEAKRIAPDYSWVYVEESDILEREDRYEEANEAADHAIRLRPAYHAAILQKATVLFHLNRDDEGIAILEEANAKVTHGTYGLKLQYYYSERDDHEKTLWALNEYERYSPLLSKKDKEWLAARKADAYYIKGDLELALKNYKLSEHKFYKTLAENLERNIDSDKQRKKLDVPFVRQHEMTCAPATLAALSKFFGKEKDHLEIADAICYEGTPWHKERGWAEDNGFAVYEFRFTQEITKALIDRNLPFTLSTNAVTSAHLQACIGYDDRLGLALIRDPTNRHYGEMLFEQLVKNHPVYGPRGMLFIPEDQLKLVEGIEFPDQDIYDHRHKLMVAIDAHDEIKMQEAMSTMRVINAEHPLVLNAQISLEHYRSNRAKVFEIQKLLHQRFPENEGLEYNYFYASLIHCPRDEQLKLGLKAIQKKHPDPVFYAELGDLYLEDLRELDIAEYYLKKSANHTFSNARSMSSLALCAYRKNELEDATDYRRYASCQSPGTEHYAYQYFELAIESDRVAEAMTYLKARTLSLGGKQSAPWITLSRAYEAIHDDTMAREVAMQALERFPTDGDLLVHVAISSFAWGNGDQAEEYLETAKLSLSEVEWNNAYALLARNTGDRQKALRYYKRSLEIDPLQTGRLRSYTDLLEEEYGQAYVINYLENLMQDHQNSASMLEFYASKLLDFSHDDAQEVLRKLLAKEPNNLWAMQKLALQHEDDGEVEEGIALAETCLQKQPNSQYAHGVLAGIYARNERHGEAIDLLKKALILDADYTFAIRNWLDLLDTDTEKLEALKFYKKQLDHQSVSGGSIFEYRELAYRHIEPDELLSQLQILRKKQPSEWATWTAEKDQLLAMGREEDAAKLISKAEEKFPYIPRIYAEKAEVYRTMGNMPLAIESYEKALELSPSWDWAARQLADAYEYQGEVVKAEAVLREALRWDPLNPANAGCLADLLERIGKKEEAFDALAEALKKSPMYFWGWREIAGWSIDQDRKAEVLSLLEIHHKTHSESKQWWEICFDVYDILGEDEMALEYCEACIVKDPKHPDMYDSKAYLLAKLRRFEEAVEATTPEVFGSEIPPILQSRRALITYSYKGIREAMKMMEILAESHPNFIPAVKNLTEWHYEIGSNEKAEKYGKQWLRLAPQSHIAMGYLGGLCEIRDDKKKAAEYYEKAFLINSEYAFAGYRAFQLHLEDKELDKLPKIIQLTSHFGRYSEALEMRVRYLKAIGETDEAFEVFKELMMQEDLAIEEIGKTVDLFPKKGAKYIVYIVEKGEAKSKSLIQAWLWGRKNFFKCADKIVKLPYPKEMKHPLWQDQLKWLLDFDDAADMVGETKRKYYAEFYEDTLAWGRLIQACVRYEAYEVGCSVFADLSKHEQRAEDWIMTNAALCQIAVNGILAAEETIDHGLQLRSENGADFLLGMKAMIEAGRGNIGRAEQLLEARSESPTGGALDMGILTKKMIACMTDDLPKQKAHWQRFQKEEPNWRNIKYYQQIIRYCKKSAKDAQRKWIGGRRGLKTQINEGISFWWIVLAFILLRMLYKMFKE